MTSKSELDVQRLRGSVLRTLRSIFRKENGAEIGQVAMYRALHRIARDRAPFITNMDEKKILNAFVLDPRMSDPALASSSQAQDDDDLHQSPSFGAAHGQLDGPTLAALFSGQCNGRSWPTTDIGGPAPID